ncbi:hypothetical protein AB0H12_25395 [Actinosynnema sp. NPDC023794]
MAPGLRPGDLLNDRVNDGGGRHPYHAILFGGWENSAKTSFWCYSFGSPPIDKVTGASFSRSSLSGHPTSHYRALRYREIVDGGVYFGHNAEGGLLRYRDSNPYDGSGADLSGPDTVDPQGWSQVLLSAQPGTVA